MKQQSLFDNITNALVLLGIGVFLFNASFVSGASSDLHVEKVLRVYDGDTFFVNLEGQLPSIFKDNLSIRISNIDTPEILGQCEYEKVLAQQARLVVEDLLLTADRVELQYPQRDKYFRVNAVVVVYKDKQKIVVHEKLLSSGLAVPYDGGTKSDWCSGT